VVGPSAFTLTPPHFTLPHNLCHPKHFEQPPKTNLSLINFFVFGRSLSFLLLLLFFFSVFLFHPESIKTPPLTALNFLGGCFHCLLQQPHPLDCFRRYYNLPSFLCQYFSSSSPLGRVFPIYARNSVVESVHYPTVCSDHWCSPCTVGRIRRCWTGTEGSFLPMNRITLLFIGPAVFFS